MSFYIVSATNGGSIIGRIVPALISDMVGRFNIAAPVALLMGLLSIIVWRFAQSVGAVFAFGTFYGCFAGAFLAMQIPCVTQISKMEVVGTRIGILYSVSSFAYVNLTESERRSSRVDRDAFTACSQEARWQAHSRRRNTEGSRVRWCCAAWWILLARHASYGQNFR